MRTRSATALDCATNDDKEMSKVSTTVGAVRLVRRNSLKLRKRMIGWKVLFVAICTFRKLSFLSASGKVN